MTRLRVKTIGCAQRVASIAQNVTSPLLFSDRPNVVRPKLHTSIETVVPMTIFKNRFFAGIYFTASPTNSGNRVFDAKISGFIPPVVGNRNVPNASETNPTAIPPSGPKMTADRIQAIYVKVNFRLNSISAPPQS